MYESDAEANQKIGNSILLYKGQPVLIGNTQGRMVEVYTLPLRLEPVKKVSLDDPDLTYRRMQLGYVNLPDRADYLMRVAIRRSRQGLGQENLRLFVEGRRRDIPWNTLLETRALVNTMTGVYPTFAEALDQIDWKYEKMRVDINGRPIYPSVAFTRTLAVERRNLRTYFLCYRGNQVCATVGKPKGFKLLEEYQHLKEALEESKVPLL